MITLTGVGRRYPSGTEALADVTLAIGDGALLALLGPSGCGKSTLLRLLAGLDGPDAGRIEGLPAERGVVFQEPTLLPWASALENVALPLRLRDEPVAPARAALASVGLAGFEGARPAALSGGMRMRVALARAMVRRPALLLLDEPLAALDEFTRERLQDEIRGLVCEAGCTTVFVTHSVYEAAYLATDVAVMTPRPGRIARVLHFAAGVTDRLSDAYAARVREISAVVRAAVPA